MKKILFLLAIFPLMSCQNNSPYVPPAYAFNTDSWDVINEVAKGGLNNLIDTYHPKNDSFIISDLADENEVKEKTRTVHIDGLGRYDVRVIGEEHDKINKGKTAPLTFEFVGMIHSIPYSLDASHNNQWVGSHLRDFLNNNLIKLFTPELQSAIKVVNKETINKNTGKIETSTERVFPISYTEIGGASDESHALEGKLYKFYETHQGEEVRIKDDKTEHKGERRYWLRSPCVDSMVNCYYVNEHGNFSLDDVCIQLGVSPVFVI